MLWCVFLCLVITVVRGQLPLTEDGIVVSNTGIQVPLGRSVYLTSNELRIRVAEGDRCTVTVLDNDPLAQLPGRLTPTSFNCNFGPREVVYSHFGSRNPPTDRVRLQVRNATLTRLPWVARAATACPIAQWVLWVFQHVLPGWV